MVAEYPLLHSPSPPGPAHTCQIPTTFVDSVPYAISYLVGMVNGNGLYKIQYNTKYNAPRGTS